MRKLLLIIAITLFGTLNAASFYSDIHTKQGPPMMAFGFKSDSHRFKNPRPRNGYYELNDYFQYYPRKRSDFYFEIGAMAPSKKQLIPTLRFGFDF